MIRKWVAHEIEFTEMNAGVDDWVLCSAGMEEYRRKTVSGQRKNQGAK